MFSCVPFCILGVTISSEGEEEYSIYAPNEECLKEALKKIDEILSEKVCHPPSKT